MWKELNGKKKIIIPTVALVPVALLLLSLQIGYNGKVIANEVKLEVCEETMEGLKDMPIQIAKLETNDKHIKAEVGQIQKSIKTIESDIKQILRAVK